MRALLIAPAAVAAALAVAPQAAVGAAPAVVPRSVAGEPLFARIVVQARALEGEVSAWRAAGASPAAPALPGFSARIKALAALDMQGHLALARSGADGDLKCILKGIAEDLPGKLAALQTAREASARGQALSEMFYLLRDNVEVITTPPALPPTTPAT